MLVSVAGWASLDAALEIEGKMFVAGGVGKMCEKKNENDRIRLEGR